MARTKDNRDREPAAEERGQLGKGPQLGLFNEPQLAEALTGLIEQGFVEVVSYDDEPRYELTAKARALRSKP